MPRNMRRVSRVPSEEQPRPVQPSPQLTRALRHLLGDFRARVLPSDRELDTLAAVRPPDIDRAVSLWDAAQQQAGTGLEGMLDAATGEDA